MHLESRGPAVFFADRAYWDDVFSTEPHREWVSSPEVAMLGPLLHLSASGASRRVLHVGCGTSSLGPFIAQEIGVHVHNLDSSVNAIEAARADRGHSSLCSWAVGDATALRKVEQTYDAVIDKGLVDSLLHGGAYMAASYIQGAADVLAPGGTLVSVSDELHAESRLELMRAALHGHDGISDNLCCNVLDGFALYTARKPSLPVAPGNDVTMESDAQQGGKTFQNRFIWGCLTPIKLKGLLPPTRS